MNKPSLSFFAALVLLLAPLPASATQTPYYDGFDVPAYANNTSVVGQNGWTLQSGTASQGNIISDPTGSGRGTVLQILNGTGTNYANVIKTIPAITAGNVQVTFDIYGDLPGQDIPAVQFLSPTGSQAALLEGLNSSPNVFRVNNSTIITGITPQASTWYTVTILFHMAASTFDITITNGTQTGSATGLAFWSSGITEISQINVFPIFEGNYSNDRGLFDNFTLTPTAAVDFSASFASGATAQTALGTATPTKDTGISQVGAWLQFGASGSELEYSANKNVPSSGAGEVSMWVQPNWLPSDGLFHLFWTMQGTGQFSLYKHESGENLIFYIVGAQGGNSAAVVPISSWTPGSVHYITGSWAPGVIKVTCDGNESNQVVNPALSLPAVTSSSVFFVGDYYDSTYGSQSGLSGVADTLIQQVNITDNTRPPIMYLTPLPSENLLETQIDLAQFAPVWTTGWTISVEILDGNGNVVSTTPITTFTAPYAQATINTASLAAGNYTVCAILRDASGNFLADTNGTFTQISPPVWAGNTIGIDTTNVPAPWTPIVPTIGNPTSTFGVLQSLYTYTNTSSLLPSQISSVGGNLLSGPIQLTGTPTTNISLTEQSASGQTVNFTTTNGTASVVQSIAFDGMLWCQVTLPKGTYSSLSLSIPMTLANSTLYYANSGTNAGTANTWGTTAASLTIPWQNSVWVGNENEGLTYFAESNQYWNLSNTSKAITLVRNGTNTTLTVTFINKSITYTTPVVFSFGIQATPTRPQRAGWRQLQELDALPNTPAHSNLNISWWTLWCPYIGDPYDANVSQMVSQATESHSLGMKAVPYIPLGNLNSALSVLTTYGGEWLVQPPSGGGGENGQTLDGIGFGGTGTQSASNYYIYGMNQMVAAASWDGFYFDNANGPPPDSNPHDGTGYVNSSGVTETTYDVFGYRNFLFRTMMMLNDNYQLSDPIIVGHVSYALITPIQSMCNVWVDGEQYESQTSNDYTSLITLPQFRAKFLGQQFGAVPIMLCEMSSLNSEWLQGQVTEAFFDAAQDTYLIFPMLHGTLIDPDWMDFSYIQPLLNIRRSTFGTCNFVGYWQNSPSIQVSPVATTLQASVYTLPDKLLVVVANLSASSTTAAVTLNMAALAPSLNSSPVVTDILTGHGTQSLSGNVLTASVPAKSLRVIEISNPVAPPNLLSAASIQTHAGTSFLPIALPVTGNQGVECRNTNGSLNIVFTFDQPVTSGTAALTNGTGTLGTPSFSGSTMTVSMSGVSDAQNLTITLSNLNGIAGTTSLNFGVLVGDVNGDGAVNSQDLIGVRNALGTQVGGAGFNAADDINEDGAVNSQDLIQVRNRLGNQLP